MIRTVKMSEQMRKEYRILPAVIMDAIDEGEARGLAKGSRQAKLETAKLMKEERLSLNLITKITGLSQAEVEAL